MRIRKRWVALGVFLALFGALVYFMVDLMLATPSPRFNAAERMDRLVRSVQPDGENSWPAYWAVLRGETPGGEASASLWPLRLGRDGEQPPQQPQVGAWDDPRHDRWREIYAEAAQQVEAFIEATMLPGYRRVLTSDADSLDAPPDGDPSVAPTAPLAFLWSHLAIQRQFGTLLVVGMRSAAAEDDWDEVVRLAGAGVRTGRHNTLQGVAIEWLVGLSQISRVLEETRRLLMERDVPPEACRALLEVIGEPAALTAPPTHVVEAERVWTQDMLQWMFDEKGRMVVWAPNSTRPNFVERVENLFSFLYPPYEETAGQIDAFFDEAAKAARGEPVDQARIDQLIKSNRFVEVLGPVMFRTLQHTAYFMQQAAGTRVMLHLEIFHDERGRWPDALADAMPVEETICPGTGDAFEYIPREGGYDLFIPRSAPDPQGENWADDSMRRLNAPREPFVEE